MIGRAQAEEVMKRALRYVQADQAEAVLLAHDEALTRFANNSIHQNVAETDAALTVRAVIGRRQGAATTNDLSEAALQRAAARAREIALRQPEDPDHPGLPAPAAVRAAPAFDEAVAGMSPEARARAVGAVCRKSAEAGLSASGAFRAGAIEVGVANTLGVLAYHATTRVDFQTVAMDGEASGRAQSSGWRAADLNVEAVGDEAIGKARRSRDPRKFEPGEYAVVLDAYVTEDILSSLNVYGMGAQAVQERRSWMNDRLGQAAMSAGVSIWDDGCDLSGAPLPFDFEGVPKARTKIVEAGVVQGPVYDTYTAKKDGKASTGHALPPNLPFKFGPAALNLFMAPGEATLEEMIRSTRKGLYITRFWYTRLVHPRDCIVTGMTRDGLFAIENGEIAYPVKNLRFTQSYVEALANVELVSREVRLLADEWGFAVSAPALKIGGWRFTGSTV